MSPLTEDTTREARKWMEGAVFRALHSQLRSKEKRPVLRTSEAAAWLTWHAAGESPLEFRIEEPEWWNPLTEAHAVQLADRLLTGLRDALRRRDHAGQRV